MSVGSTSIADAPQAQPNHLARAAVTWAILSVLGIIFVLLWMPHILITSADNTVYFANLTLLVFTAASVPVVFFVWVFIGYSLIYFREKDRPETDGPRLQPTRLTQIAWLAITGALCLFLLVWGLLGLYEQTAAAPANPLTVNVQGQQWTWTYHYPQYGITTHELYLPLNRAVRFRTISSDVLHGFAIDQLGVRMDANPEQWTTNPFVTPTRLGNYDTRCVEFCGLYHSYMFTPVKVVTRAQFLSWVKQQGGHV